MTLAVKLNFYIRIKHTHIFKNKKLYYTHFNFFFFCFAVNFKTASTLKTHPVGTPLDLYTTLADFPRPVLCDRAKVRLLQDTLYRRLVQR